LTPTPIRECARSLSQKLKSRHKPKLDTPIPDIFLSLSMFIRETSADLFKLKAEQPFYRIASADHNY